MTAAEREVVPVGWGSACTLRPETLFMIIIKNGKSVSDEIFWPRSRGRKLLGTSQVVGEARKSNF
jgi:hypothetical protein